MHSLHCQLWLKLWNFATHTHMRMPLRRLGFQGSV